MGSFSAIHWLIALLVIAPVAALMVVPAWRILQRSGHNGAWALLMLVPVLGFVVLWVLAFSKWPNDKDGKTSTSVPGIILGIVLVPLSIGSVVALTAAFPPASSRPPGNSQAWGTPLGPKMSYSEKVRRLSDAAEAGALKTIDVRAAAPSDNLIDQWPASDASRIEAGQTWWVSNGTAWIHIANHYSSAIEVIHFSYAQGLCESPSGSGPAAYNLPLLQPIAPGTQALVRFAAGDVIAYGSGCLLITGVQGRPAENAPGRLNSGPNFFDQFDR